MASARITAEAAAQDYDLQQQLLAADTAKLTVARRAQTLAQGVYTRARAAFITLVQNQYEQGGSSVGILLSAPDPEWLLSSLTVARQLSTHQSSVVDDQATALADLTAIKQRARDAAVAQSAAASRSAQDLRAARSALQLANSGEASLRKKLVQARTNQLLANAALAALSQINGGLSLAQELTISAGFRAREAAIEASVPVLANPGHWTAALGQSAALRALEWVGLPYSWAGGNGSGPTLGVCSSGGGEHDCSVWGFDCSGLALYGWSAYLSLPHSAAAQYSVAGRVHPSLSQLQPGDLVFFSSSNSASGIYHVVMYIGGGRVVQAPESGELVSVTALSAMPTPFGATRPLS